MRATPLDFVPPAASELQPYSPHFFADLSTEQFGCVRRCLGLQSFAFERGDEILTCAGGRQYYGVILTGTAFDVRHHADGEQSLTDVLEPGDLLGDGWRAGTWHTKRPTQERAAIGASAGTVLLLDPARLSDPTVTCSAKGLVQNNLLRSVLHKEERLRTKLEILRHRSLRGRIANYLVVEAHRRGAAQFIVPLSRDELARYLHVDRAALSRELARMRTEELLDFHRSSFSLTHREALERLAS